MPELSTEPMRQVDAWPLVVVHAVASAASEIHLQLPDVQRIQRGEWAGYRDYTLIMLAALTGLRQSELLGLRWDQKTMIGCTGFQGLG